MSIKNFFHKILGRSDVYFANSLYMIRWRIIDWISFGIRVHFIARSDTDRELHDHPFTFVSFILKGGYWEHTIDGKRTWYGPGSIVFRTADVLHRLELPESRGVETPAWTFVIRGARRREWGFLTGHGWVNWQNFTAMRDTGTVSNNPFRASSSL